MLHRQSLDENEVAVIGIKREAAGRVKVVKAKVTKVGYYKRKRFDNHTILEYCQCCDPNEVSTENPNPSDTTNTKVIEVIGSKSHCLELIFYCKKNETYSVVGDDGVIIVSQPYSHPITLVCDFSGQWYGYDSEIVVTSVYCSASQCKFDN